MEVNNGDPLIFRIFDWIITGVFTVSTAVVGFLVNSATAKVDKQSEEIGRLWKAHSAFREHVSDTYVKNPAIERVYDTLDEIKEDIKQLLQR